MQRFSADFLAKTKDLENDLGALRAPTDREEKTEGEGFTKRERERERERQEKRPMGRKGGRREGERGL